MELLHRLTSPLVHQMDNFRQSWCSVNCHNNRQIKCVPLATEHGISLIILPLMRILQWNLKRATDTFLFISHTTNVLLFKFRCNIFIGVRIIKEMPGSVPSGTHCTIYVPTTLEKKGKFDFIIVALLEVKAHMAPHIIITPGYTILSYFYGNASVDSAGINTRISGPSTIWKKLRTSFSPMFP